MAPTLQLQRPWAAVVKQVTKSNFSASLPEIKTLISKADFIAVSLKKTGAAFSPAWRRVLPIDTSDTAYRKVKHAAENFELLQFAVCPFTLRGSKLLAHPYNFHLFPRDELNIGMPSYSFSCQTSCLTSMAREGYDFNVCIYDGISYLSRVQESKAKGQIENPVPSIHPVKSLSSPSVADTIFMERIKSRVRHWRDACKDSNRINDEALLRSLRKLILGSEVYGSRPCLNIDVCSDRQVQLALETLSEFSDDLVPLVIPEKGRGAKVVRVVLTNSEEDKNLLIRELQNLEEEQNKQLRGFREVIDAMSTSCKPIVAYSCLDDFTFIHSKFLAPLPPSMSEFMCSLRLVFSHILDVNHLLKEIGPLKKAKNLPAAISYLKRHFFVPIEMEIPHQDQENLGSHGHNVIRITELFAKVSSLLKIDPVACQSVVHNQMTTIEEHANIFYPCCTSLQEPMDSSNIRVWMDNAKKLSTDNMVFLWGFRGRVSAGRLKSLLHRTHDLFSEENFEVKLADKSCAVVVFWRPGSAEALLKTMDSGGVGSSVLREMISEGLKAAGYGTYEKVCRLGFWEENLADSLNKALTEPTFDLSTASRKIASDIYWSSDDSMMINLNDL